MNYQRTAAIGVAGGALAAWLAAAGTSDVRVSPIVAKTTPIEQSGADLAREIGRLRERLRPRTLPGQQQRNLFRFNAAPPPRGEATGRSAGRSAISEPAPTPAALPGSLLRLSGMAEDPGPDGPIRTAIISSPGELWLVKEGDSVTPRYRVAKISPDAVELVEIDTNLPLRLAFR